MFLTPPKAENRFTIKIEHEFVSFLHRSATFKTDHRHKLSVSPCKETKEAEPVAAVGKALCETVEQVWVVPGQDRHKLPQACSSRTRLRSDSLSLFFTSTHKELSLCLRLKRRGSSLPAVSLRSLLLAGVCMRSLFARLFTLHVLSNLWDVGCSDWILLLVKLAVCDRMHAFF